MLASYLGLVTYAVACAGHVVFKVSDFSAACATHSFLCLYSFGVIDPGNGETIPALCNASIAGYGFLGNIVDGNCSFSSRTWSILRKPAGQLEFNISQPVTPSSDEVGSYTIPATDITVDFGDPGRPQIYIGPTDLDLTE